MNRLVSWVDQLRRRENQLALVLSLMIGALVGLVVVAFILLTGRIAAQMYPPGGSGWRRILVLLPCPGRDDRSWEAEVEYLI